MLYAGTYDSRLFQIITEEKRMRIVIYSTGEDKAPGTVSLNSAFLNNSTRVFEGNILAAGVVKQLSKIEQYAGSEILLAEFIKVISVSKLFEALEAGKYFASEERIQGHLLKTEIANDAIYKFGTIRGLKFTKLTSVKSQNQALEEDSTYSSMQYAILSRRLKTFQELCEQYDMSWYMDANGKRLRDYELVTTEERLIEVLDELQRLPSVTLVGFDTEFSRREVRWQQKKPARLFGMSLSWRDKQAAYIVFESNKTGHVDRTKWLPKIIEVINAHNIALGAHNAFAEIQSCWNHGSLPRITYDSLLVEFNLNPDHKFGPRDLKSLSRIYFNEETWELDQLFNGKVIAELIPDLEPEVLMIYACADADQQRRILLRQKQDIDIDKATCKLDVNITEMLSLAEYYGARIDMDLLKKLRAYNREDMRRVEFIAFEYLKEIGLKTQAISYLPEGAELTEENIAKVLMDEKFQEDMKRLFCKDKLGKGKTLQKLTLQSPDDKKILYTILKYPVTRYNKDTKAISADADALEDLLAMKTKNPIHFLKQTMYSSMSGTPEAIGVRAKDLILLDKKKFEEYRYPFAYILSAYRKLFKRETSLFKKIEEGSASAWYYTGISMISARTARVTGPIQTIEGPLKKLITVFSQWYWYMVFDFSQIEFRTMIGIANVWWKMICTNLMNSPDPRTQARGREMYEKNLDHLVVRLDDCDNDYHREGGSLLVDKAPKDMTPDDRSEVKPVHFSVPFGAGAYSISKEARRKAKTEAEADEETLKVEGKLAAWRNNLFPLYAFLEYNRDQALIQIPDDKLPTRLKGMRVGCVRNALGRVRYFKLDPRAPYASEIEELVSRTGLSQKVAVSILQNKIADAHIYTIRREVGNFPIQSFAREIFFTAMYKLYVQLKQERLTAQTRDFFKCLMSIFVHDECGIQVHKSVHVYRMYKFVQDNCLIKLDGHPLYFMNIAVAENWLDGKTDALEASPKFVKECVAKYEANPEYYDKQAYFITDQKAYALAGITNHIRQRVANEFGAMLKEHNMDLDYCIQNFETYYLMQRLKDYCVKLDPNGKDEVKELIKFAFASKCYDPEIRLDGETCDELRAKWADRIAEHTVSEMDYVSEEQQVPYEDVNGITNLEQEAKIIAAMQESNRRMREAGFKVEVCADGKTFSDDGSLSSLESQAINMTLDDLVSTNAFGSDSSQIDLFRTGFEDDEDEDLQSLEQPGDSLFNFDTSILDELNADESIFTPESLDELLTPNAVFSEDQVYAEAQDTRVSELREDEDDWKEYSDMINSEETDLVNGVILNYIGSEEMEEDSREIKPTFKTRTVIFQGGLFIDTKNVSQETLQTAMDYLRQFKTEKKQGALALAVQNADASVTWVEGVYVNQKFSREKLNKLLNGVNVHDTV